MTTANGGWRGYALGVALTVCGAFGTWTWTSVSADVKQLQRDSAIRSERQARTEAEVAGMKEKLDRIETKVDQLLERAPRR